VCNYWSDFSLQLNVPMLFTSFFFSFGRKESDSKVRDFCGMRRLFECTGGWSEARVDFWLQVAQHTSFLFDLCSCRYPTWTFNYNSVANVAWFFFEILQDDLICVFSLHPNLDRPTIGSRIWCIYLHTRIWLTQMNSVIFRWQRDCNISCSMLLYVNLCCFRKWVSIH
jgi:hypothetical protein